MLCQSEETRVDLWLPSHQVGNSGEPLIPTTLYWGGRPAFAGVGLPIGCREGPGGGMWAQARASREVSVSISGHPGGPAGGTLDHLLLFSTAVFPGFFYPTPWLHYHSYAGMDLYFQLIIFIKLSYVLNSIQFKQKWFSSLTGFLLDP